MATSIGDKFVKKHKQTFSYCELCRHSHDKGRKHAFSRRHRDKVKTILSKYSAKVKLAKQDMKEPCVMAGSFEPNVNYWCYMCACEVSKHVTDREVTVRHAGFIEHLMSLEHAQKVDKFWRVNRIETDLQTKFIFPESAREFYRKAVEEALTRHEEREERLLSQSAAKIRKLESNRSQLLQWSESTTSMLEPSEVCHGEEEHPPLAAAPSTRVEPNGDSNTRMASAVPSRTGGEANSGAGRWPREEKMGNAPGCSSWSNLQTSDMQNPRGSSTASQSSAFDVAVSGFNQQDPVCTGSNQVQATGKSTAAGQLVANPGVLNRVRTIGVISSGGLTAVNIKDRGFAGNIHSGAPPPWLRDEDDEEGEGRRIGPSEEDFKKHLERQRKSKLNPGRVGANFDHATPASEEWLPSFGRVWNSGRRWQSRHQYRKEVGKSKQWKGRQPSAHQEGAPHTQ